MIVDGCARACRRLDVNCLYVTQKRLYMCRSPEQFTPLDLTGPELKRVLARVSHVLIGAIQ